jgi:hypothetical protein
MVGTGSGCSSPPARATKTTLRTDDAVAAAISATIIADALAEELGSLGGDRDCDELFQLRTRWQDAEGNACVARSIASACQHADVCARDAFTNAIALGQRHSVAIAAGNSARASHLALMLEDEADYAIAVATVLEDATSRDVSPTNETSGDDRELLARLATFQAVSRAGARRARAAATVAALRSSRARTVMLRSLAHLREIRLRAHTRPQAHRQTQRAGHARHRPRRLQRASRDDDPDGEIARYRARLGGAS